MADCVPGAWAVKTVGDQLMMGCDVTIDGATNDCYTLKTPANTLDTTKPWTLYVNTGEVTIDAEDVPVDIWAGYKDNFALSGDDDISATSGGEVASAVINTCNWDENLIIDPNYREAKVQTTEAGSKTGIRNCGTAPYYIINLDGGSDFEGVLTVHFVITQ